MLHSPPLKGATSSARHAMVVLLNHVPKGLCSPQSTRRLPGTLVGRIAFPVNQVLGDASGCSLAYNGFDDVVLLTLIDVWGWTVVDVSAWKTSGFDEGLELGNVDNGMNSDGGWKLELGGDWRGHLDDLERSVVTRTKLGLLVSGDA